MRHPHPFRNITWPTGVSIHGKTLKGGKVHGHNDILLNEIDILFKRPSTKLVLLFTLIFVQKASYSRVQCLSLTESL